MKLIIAGSRKFTDSGLCQTIMTMLVMMADKCLNNDVDEIVTGGAKGVDHIGKCLAFYSKKPHKEFPADWDQHGKAAGPIRNRQMAEYGDALILIWDGESRGSASMKREAQKANIPVYECILRKS